MGLGHGFMTFHDLVDSILRVFDGLSLRYGMSREEIKDCRVMSPFRCAKEAKAKGEGPKREEKSDFMKALERSKKGQVRPLRSLLSMALRSVAMPEEAVPSRDRRERWFRCRLR